jgi:hypothetical protein
MTLVLLSLPFLALAGAMLSMAYERPQRPLGYLVGVFGLFNFCFALLLLGAGLEQIFR